MEALGLVLILYVAYFADFKMQSRDIATRKSVNFEALNLHVLTIIGTLFWPCWLVFGLKYSAPIGFIMAMFFTVINGIIHGVIDWNIWKGYKKNVAKNIHQYFKEQSPDDIEERYPSLKDYTEAELRSVFMKEKMYAEDKKFYDTIGFDGYLHVATIILLYAWFMH
jgi:hypothetical protein